MSDEFAHPFDSIESAQEFLVLFAESIEEALEGVQQDIDSAKGSEEERRVQALTLALYKMTQLSSHVHKSRRILNDLRSIRRLLFNEREALEPEAAFRASK